MTDNSDPFEAWLAILDRNTHRAIVLDPGDEPRRLLDATADGSVDTVVSTHSHWDHVLALPEVADASGCPVRLHPDDTPVWPHERAHLARLGRFDAGPPPNGS